jgi:hypothetical protein
MFGPFSLMPAVKPSVRAFSTVDPVWLPMIRTVPLPPADVASASPASLPPCAPLDWMFEEEMLVSVRSPSMVMILMPADFAFFSG